MKIIAFLAVILLNSAIGFGQSAEFFVEKPLYKFPKTEEGVVLQHDFIVKNTGTEPLVITGFKVACTCTKISLPENPIQPGETAIISVIFDTNGKSYEQDREILLVTNTKNQLEKLRFKVFVVPENN